jgi:pantoate kinase
MNTDPMEILLAQLFATPIEVERFLQDRESYARRCGLTAEHVMQTLEIDAASLRFAASSFARKRRSRD